jgi:hypothetical protein
MDLIIGGAPGRPEAAPRIAPSAGRIGEDGSGIGEGGIGEGGPEDGAALSNRRPLPPSAAPAVRVQFLSHKVKLWSPNRNRAQRPWMFTSLKVSANSAPSSTV